MHFRDDLIEQKCLCCNHNYQQKFDEKFDSKFDNHGNSKCIAAKRCLSL